MTASLILPHSTTTNLETDQHLAAEERVMHRLRDWYPGLEWQKGGQYDRWDFWVRLPAGEQGQWVYRYLEVKCRNYRSDSFPTSLVHKSKYQALVKHARATSTRTLIVTHWLRDDVITTHRVNPDRLESYETSFQSRTDRNYRPDSAPKILIPSADAAHYPAYTQSMSMRGVYDAL